MDQGKWYRKLGYTTYELFLTKHVPILELYFREHLQPVNFLSNPKEWMPLKNEAGLLDRDP